MTQSRRIITRTIIGISSLIGSRFLLNYIKKEVNPRNIHPYFKHPAPFILSHRGGMYERPEHTALAFDHSEKLGLTGFEIDIRISKDEHVIVFHDADVDRTTNGSGRVVEYTLDELKKLDAGYRFTDINGTTPYKNHPKAKIMTLDELFARYPDQLVNIDIKDHPETYEGSIAAERLYQTIVKHDAQQRVLVTSFHKEQIERFNLYHSNDIATGASQAEVTEGILKFYTGFSKLYDGQALTFQMPLSYKGLPLTSKRFISWLNSRQIAPGYYGVNSIDLMCDLIALGVHTIVTDRPTLAQQFKTINLR